MPDVATLDLPIVAALPELRRALRDGTSAVLRAPPGAGKTTVVPLALLDESWLRGQRIVMLEPRRLAARAAAHRMATLRGERVGETVGYRIRLDTRVGPRTRVEVVTEGILTRMLQSDPALEGVGLVVFDEFHERSLTADLGLALTLQSRAILREELRVLAMSATIDGAAVAALLGGAPVVASEGRAHPVEVRYAGRRADAPLEPQVGRAVHRALTEEGGDVLVFLPGVAEIRRVESLLHEAGLGPEVDLWPLFGNLPQEAQDAAIRPSPAGRRKVVLSTSIAETSLTIEGVRAVVDSGLARVPRFSVRTGMTRLETVRVSRAAAEQRRGRAGRLGPGVCVRLWAEHEQAQLLERASPEILEADLAPLALDLAAAGVLDPAELAWLDPPPAPAFARARELLHELDALGADGRITGHGRRMAQLPLHPRLAHMTLRAESLGATALACDLAALLSERDVLRGERGAPDADVRLRLDALRGQGPREGHGWSVDRDAVRRVREVAAQLRSQIGAGASSDADVGALLALAYPDRVAQRRPGQLGRFLLREGGGAAFAEPQSLSDEPYIVAAELDGRRPESRIFLAAPIALADIEAHLGDQIERERVVEWDDEVQAVRGRERERLGALVLSDAPLRDPDPADIAAALVGWIEREGLGVLPWSKAARQLQARLAFLRALDPAWPDVSDAALRASLSDWLLPHLHGLRRRDDLARLDLTAILMSRLTWPQRTALDELAPTHVAVPSGSRLPVDYDDPSAPALAVRLQEMFGLTDTPRIAGGRVPLTLHLLSPAQRPVQVTRDLAGFWRTTYFDVRKDLKGRYPKHHWPDDPLSAPPTSRAKRRGD